MRLPCRMTSAGFRNPQRDCPRWAEWPRASTSAVVGVSDEQFLLPLLLRIFQRYNHEHIFLFFFFFHHKNLKFFTEKPGTGSRETGPGPGDRSGWWVWVTAPRRGRAPWAGCSRSPGLPGLSWAAAWGWDGACNHILSLPCPTGHSLWPENFLVPET